MNESVVRVGSWRSIGRALPSPSVWAVLFLFTVPAPILYNSTIVEVAPMASKIFDWVEVALPVFGVVAAARWTARTGRRRSVAGFGSAVLVATLTGAVYLTLSLVTFRWIIPLNNPVGWDEFLWLPTAALGGVIGYGLGRYGSDEPPGWYWYAIGAALAALGGYLIFPTTDVGVLHGEHTDELDRDPLTVYPTAVDRYGIRRHDGLDTTPDCRITGPGLTDEPATPLTVPVDASADGTTASVVSIFFVPSAGAYTITCDIADYSVKPVGHGAPPVIRTWPVPVIVFLGALPGLVIIGDTARRRAMADRSGSAR